VELRDRLAPTELWWEVHTQPGPAEVAERFHRLLEHIEFAIEYHHGWVHPDLVAEAHRIVELYPALLQAQLLDRMTRWSKDLI
jgi:hypothetical protein